ncbi:cadherin-99C-like isoform X2 [Littorina saxatilis]|uniref:Cadherin domain-containing protein n=2 Tax=Littorina saxatilis TaxID=31220 RepID=A0AAN9BXQ6_9CAEN
MSLTTTTVRAAVLGLLFVVVPPGVRAQTSPCGSDTISIDIPEYPNSEGVVLIPPSQQNSYRKQIVQSDDATLRLTITEDPDNPSDPELRPDSTTLEVQYNALSVPRGYDLILKKGVDRDGTSATDDDDRNALQYKLECVDPTIANTVYYHVLKIQILDGNDNAPQFQGEPYQITVTELTPVGITVYSSISTTDLDNGNNKLVKYNINTASTSHFTNNSVFMLPSEDSAFVVLRQPLDYEAMVNQAGSGLLAVYRMNITATDQAQEFTPLSNWAYLNITITDGDDLGPKFIYDTCPSTPFKSCVRPKYSASITSGDTLGSLPVLPIPRLTDPTQTVPIRVRDGDSLNAVIQCSIAYTVPAGYENRFTVTTSSSAGGEYQCNVRVSTAINRADVPSLDVVIQARELTPNSYSEEAVITLDITPRNQNARSLSTNSGAFQGYILENSAVGTLVSNDTGLRGPLRLLVSDLDVSANDPPGNYEITLSPVIGFQVDAFGYIQFVQGILDYETRQQYTFEAVVRELDTNERRSSTASLTINVLDDNDNAPSVTTGLLQTSVPEGDYSGGVGQFLVRVSADDADSGVYGQLDYTILTVFPTASTNIFSIDNNGGVILQGVVVAGDSFTLQTQVSDRGTPNQRTNVAVIVDVTPVGNQPPQFTANNYTIYVSEAVPVQSSLWNIPASDPEGDALTYSIDNAVPQANAFDTLSDSLGNQILRNIITLNREQVDTHTLILSVADNGGNRTSATVTVIVLDVNDNSPRFNPTEYMFDIDENQNSGTSVGQVSATDADRQNTPFSSISYSIQPVSNDFQVDMSNGQITSRRPFDYEMQKNFTFTVLATDGGGNIGVAWVIVRVRDLQDTVPYATDEITPSNMSFPHTTMPTTSSRPSEEDRSVVGAIVGAVIGVLAAIAVIIIITVICLRSRKEADVPVNEMVTRPTGRADSGTFVLRDTTEVNVGIQLHAFVGSSTKNGVSQRPSSQTDDNYEFADVGSTENSASQRPSRETDDNYDIAYEASIQQDQLEPAASTTDPIYTEILDDQVVDNYDRPQMYENTRDHHDYTDLKSQ